MLEGIASLTRFPIDRLATLLSNHVSPIETILCQLLGQLSSPSLAYSCVAARRLSLEIPGLNPVLLIEKGFEELFR